ncbi:hypothetical protein FE840_008920 [Peteryoungia desertarenae]|uniref:Uncharacterized protein n=1 Tax=Peteryoungia desertarenae TaxID=1813451 RepID=A0ABX6QM32_9HYPH|nr:hypothetical protein [Peteryoungia desertarenae]QLF69656.1 hypothetical protein FE840_008920 [Peteryoungia desertarenae]
MDTSGNRIIPCILVAGLPKLKDLLVSFKPDCGIIGTEFPQRTEAKAEFGASPAKSWGHLTHLVDEAQKCRTGFRCSVLRLRPICDLKRRH